MTTLPSRCPQRLFSDRVVIEIPKNSSISPTVWDRLFSFCCLLYGIECGFKRRVWLDLIILAFWMIEILIYSRAAAYATLGNSTAPSESMSLCDMIIWAYYLSFSAIVCYAVLWIRLKKGICKKLLRVGGRSFKDVGLIIGCAVILLSRYLHLLMKLQWNNAYERSCYATLTVGFTTIFVIYMDITSCLIDEQRDIVQALRMSPINCRDLMEKKYSLRKRVSDTNSVFAYLLSLIYIKTFVMFIRFLQNAALREDTLLGEITFILYLSTGPVLLFVLAHKSSVFRSCCMNADFVILMRKGDGDLCNACHSDLSDVLRYMTNGTV